MERDEAVRVAVEALVDASQEDVATGGVDPTRDIYPLILVVTADGVQEVAEDEVRAAYQAVTQGAGGSR